mgnify:CR=1 FL=1
MMNEEEEPVILSTDGTLDLHQFKPSDVKEVVRGIFYECKQKGFRSGRMIQGKGMGTLREMVHSELRKNTMIQSFQLGDHNTGAWGATVFEMNP